MTSLIGNNVFLSLNVPLILMKMMKLIGTVDLPIVKLHNAKMSRVARGKLTAIVAMVKSATRLAIVIREAFMLGHPLGPDS